LLNLLRRTNLHHMFPRLLVFVMINVFMTAKIFFLLGYGWVHYVSPIKLSMLSWGGLFL
jgi:hypothetical protein